MSALWDTIATHPPDLVILADHSRSVTIRDLLARPGVPEQGPVDVIGDSSVNAVLAILDAWRSDSPVVLLHPLLPADEQRAISRDVRSAPLPTNCLAVVTTSGTTGARRYVMLSEAGMIASARASAENLGWNEDDRWWLCMPTAHVGGLAIVARCLLAGRAVFVSERFSTDAYERALAERVTLLSLVPTMLHRLIESGAPMPDSRVRAILVGGGPCPPTLTAKARELGFPVLLTWGMSEAGSQIATQSPSCRFSSEPADLSSVGRPLLGFDFDNRDGVAWFRGPALTLGYHPPGRYEQPFDADGWLESRDRVTVLEDGQLRILGRGTDMIVSGGENVYPAEVESVLSACDGVVAACVVGIPHPHWGEEVLAVVVVSGDLDRDRLILEARVRLGGYKTPRRVLSIDALPTNVNGKVDRLAIRRWAVERLA